MYIYPYNLTYHFPLEKYVLEPWEQDFPHAPRFMSSIKTSRTILKARTLGALFQKLES